VTPDDVLAVARSDDLEALGHDRDAVADAVRSFAEAGDAESALELVGRTWRMWFAAGELDEGSSLAAAALNAPGAAAVPIWRARVLYADGIFAFRAGDRDRSLARNEEALRVARETDDVRGECDALTGLARDALRDGRYEEVVSLARQARDRARTADDPAAEASPLHLEAAGVRLQGDYSRARELYLQSMEHNEKMGARAFVTMEKHNLGWVELHLGNVGAAEARFRERDAETESDAYGDAWSDLNWAAIAVAQDKRDEAEKRMAAGTDALEKLGVSLDPDDQSELDWLREQISAATP